VKITLFFWGKNIDFRGGGGGEKISVFDQNIDPCA
jgi:hypothetical protein